MMGYNANFEDVISKIVNISVRPELIGIDISLNTNEFYVYDIYLDDYEESDDYNFSWIICKELCKQSEKTQETINILLRQS